MNPYISKSIYSTRFLLILGPILIHSVLTQGCNIQSFGALLGSGSVTALYVISGYLFWGGYFNTYESFKKKVTKRIYSLLIPYVIWNVLAFVVFVAIGRLDAAHWMHALWVIPGASGPADYPLWFVRTLFVCIPVTPFMYYLNTNKYVWWVSYVFLACWFLEIPQSFSHGTFQGLALFNVGSMIRLRNMIPETLAVPGRKWAVLAIGLWITSLLLWFCGRFTGFIQIPYMGKVYKLSTIAVVYFMPVLLNDTCYEYLKLLGRKSFFLYCIFAIIIEPAKIYMKDIMGATDVAYIITFIFVVTSSLFIYEVINKFMPKICSILSGDR